MSTYSLTRFSELSEEFDVRWVEPSGIDKVKQRQITRQLRLGTATDAPFWRTTPTHMAQKRKSTHQVKDESPLTVSGDDQENSVVSSLSQNA